MTNTTDGPTEKTVEQLQHGHQVFVIPHDIQIGSTKVHIKGYSAKIVKDCGINQKGQHLVEVYSANGSHYIERQFVTTESPTKSFAVKQTKKPKFTTINCIDCGAAREILACNLHNVKRCKGCQNVQKQKAANNKHQSAAN